jgi:hypothetical protein
MSSFSNCPDRRAVVTALAAVPVLPSLFGLSGSTPARAQTQMTSAGQGFSFAACGDSRPMMYLPSKEGNPDLTQLFVEMFGLVMPDKIAEEVVKKDVKMIFDPATNELIQIVMPFMTKSEVMTLTVDKGWVTEASVEDVKLLPGVHRTMFRLQGGDWVAREIVRDVNAGRAQFVVNSGDVVWWGNLKDRGGVICRTLSKEAWCHAREPHLQVRLSGGPIHLLMDREVRLPIAFAVGWRPAEIRRADETDAAMAGRS